MKILVVNCGSSSIKFQLYAMPEQQVLAKGLAAKIGEAGSALEYQVRHHTYQVDKEIPDHKEGMKQILETLIGSEDAILSNLDEIGAVGHRVVHGGEEFTGSVQINQAVLDSIKRCADLAPLHNPANLTGIQAAMNALSDVPHIACFDTAFHATIPKVGYLYALPYEVYKKYGVRRYGFHGTSHRYVAAQTAKLLGKTPEQTNCITCHLGNGCSMAAVRDGVCVDTSMGLTPLEGLVMGTRSGDIDPAILFYLADKGYGMESLNTMCNKQSGLLGVSGISNDLRILHDKAEQGDKRAQLAIDIFCYRVKKYIGAYMAVLGRVDAISFTGGIGENSPEVRAAVCQGLESLGVVLDSDSNGRRIGDEGDVGAQDSRVRLLVVPTDEEGVIATDTYEIVMQGKKHDASKLLPTAD